MKRIIPFILFLISTACLAESGAYRVEVIVFRNLDVVADPDRTETLRSFSRFPDLVPKQVIVDATEVAGGESPDDLTPVLHDGLPDDLVVNDNRSAYMNDVWRRLRNSAAYRPLLWSSWQQIRVDYYPPMRLHNESLIAQRDVGQAKQLVQCALDLIRAEFVGTAQDPLCLEDDRGGDPNRVVLEKCARTTRLSRVVCDK